MSQAKYPVKSLIKAMTLLDAISRHEQGISISALSQELKLGKSTVHRLLATLRELNLVSFDPLTANYSLGAKVLQWAQSVTKQNLLLRLGLPPLRKLAAQCQETVNIAVMEGTEVIYLAQLVSSNTLRIAGDVGVRMPAHCTALGKILLSDLSASEFQQLFRGIGGLKPMTSNSITDPAQLWEHLQKVRQEGVSYDFEEAFEGGVCIGALIRDYSGRGVAAISISMPKQRLSGERLIKFKEFLLEASADISRNLGSSTAAEPSKVEAPEAKPGAAINA